MKIDRIYNPAPVHKKRRIGCWLFVLFLVILFLAGFWLLNLLLLPAREAHPRQTLLLSSRPEASSPWDGYIVLDMSADAPNGPLVFNNLLLFSLFSTDAHLDADKIQRLQQLILYPRIHAFLQSHPASSEERLMVMMSLKRMSKVVTKLVDQALPDVPAYPHQQQEESDLPPVFQRLQVKNISYISNHEPFLKALKDGVAIEGADATPDAGSSSSTSFAGLFEKVPPEGILKGFIINRSGRLKTLAELLNDSGNDDAYYLLGEGFDLYYPAFWEEVDWLEFVVRAAQPDRTRWTVGIQMKNRVEAMRLEQFLKERYFPRLIEGLEGRVVSDVEVSREEYRVEAGFAISLNYLKYVIDSAP